MTSDGCDPRPVAAVSTDQASRPPAARPERGHGLVTAEWVEALRRGLRPMPATLVIVAGCVGVWVASLATGGYVWSASVHGPVDHALVRNAVLIAGGQWWRALSYGTLSLSVFALVYVMALFLLAGLQVERTYGTACFLAVLVPSWTTGALVGLLVEPAHAFNAGPSGATFGVATAATIDLLRRGVRWQRTFWIPTLAIILVLGFVFPASVTWGAHVGGIIAGGVVGMVACDPRRAQDRRGSPVQSRSRLSSWSPACWPRLSLLATRSITGRSSSALPPSERPGDRCGGHPCPGRQLRHRPP